MGVTNFEELEKHEGHEITCISYTDKKTREKRNVAVECETCHEVLLDFDKGQGRRSCKIMRRNIDQEVENFVNSISDLWKDEPLDGDETEEISQRILAELNHVNANE